MRILSLFTAVLLTLITSTSLADGSESNVSIKTVFVHNANGVYFKTVETMSPHGCTSSAWYKVKNASTYADETYSLLLAAQMSDKTIDVTFEGCEANSPAVKYISVNN